MIRTKKFENLPQITSISPSGKIVVTENGVDKVISFEDFSNLPPSPEVWNNPSTTFTASEVNVTDTQSAADSKLLDLKVNTTSKFVVRKDGNLGIGVTNPAARLDISDAVLSGSGSLAGSVLNLAQTWNTTGNPTAIKLNVTNTNSGATSNLLDLQVGGLSQFNVTKAGIIILNDNFALRGVPSSGWVEIGGKTNILAGTSKVAIWEHILGLVQLANNGSFGWSSLSSAANGSTDLALARDAAGTLAQRNGVSPQTFRIYNTYTSSTNFERLNLRWDSNILKIGTEKGGAGGVARDLAFETDAATRMTVTSAGNVGIATADPTYIFSVKPNSGQGGQIGFGTLPGFASPALYLEDYSRNTIFKLGQDNSGVLKLLANGNGVCLETTGLYTTISGNGTFVQAGNGTATIQGNYGKILLDAFTNNAIQFFAGTAMPERMRILGSNGNVGIGTTTPLSPLHILSGVNSNIYLASTTANAGTHEIRFGFHTLNSYAASIVGITTGSSGRGNLEFRVAAGGDATNAVQSDTGLRITSTDVQILKSLTYSQDVLAIGNAINSGVKAFKFTRSENKAAIWSVPVGSQGNGDIRFTTGNDANSTPKTESDATVIISRNGGLVIGNSYINEYPTNGNLLVQNNIGVGNTSPISKLDIAETWNSNISVTGASGTGSVATITFATQAEVIPVGATVVVSSVNPSGYNGTFVVTASTVTSISYTNSTSTTYVSGGTVQQLFTAVKVNVTDTASNAASKLLDLQVGGVSKALVDKTGNVEINNSAAFILGSNAGFFSYMSRANNSYGVGFGYTNSIPKVYTSPSFNMEFGNAVFSIFNNTGSFTIGANQDVVIRREDVGILAQRNGINPQAFRLYNTYTGVTTFERLNIKWDTNVLKIGTEKGSVGGTARDLVLETDGTERVRVLSTGNLGIGTITPQNKLDVNGDTRLGGWLHIDRTGGSITSYLAFRARGASEAGNFGNAAGNGQFEINAINGSGLVIGTNLTSPIILAAGGAERIRVLGSNGNIGIGTTNPQSNLEIYGATSTLTINTGDGSTTAGLRFAHRDSVYADSQIKVGIFAPAAGSYGLSTGLFFALNNATDNTNVSVTDSKLAILANGNLGIGTSTPSTKLEIVTTGSTDGLKLKRADDDRTAWLVDEGTGTGALYLFNGLNSNTVYITGNGNSYISSGNLGLGTNSATAKLDILDTTLAGSGSLAGSILNLAQTWNTTGAPTAIKLNVTNTASGAASNLLDLQVGGVSQFNVRKDGLVNVPIIDAAPNTTPGYFFGGGRGCGTANEGNSSTLVFWSNSSKVAGITNNGSQGQFAVVSHGFIGFLPASNFNAATDVSLYRDAAGILAQRNGVNPQTFRLYNTYTDATTFERLNIKWDTNVLKIGTEKGSVGGTARNLELQIDGTTRLTLTSGNADFGVMVRSGGFFCNGGSGLMLALDGNYNTGVRLQSFVEGICRIANANGTDFNRLQFGGTTSSFPSIKRNGAALQIRLADDSANAALETAGLTVVGSASVSGHFSAATKSFLIDHPTKEGKKLQYGVVESNQHSVLVRGKTAENIIELPEEWAGLVHEDSVTVQLTPIGSYQQLFVISQDNQRVVVGGSTGQYNYTIYGERKDVDKLQTVV